MLCQIDTPTTVKHYPQVICPVCSELFPLTRVDRRTCGKPRCLRAFQVQSKSPCACGRPGVELAPENYYTMRCAVCKQIEEREAKVRFQRARRREVREQIARETEFCSLDWQQFAAQWLREERERQRAENAPDWFESADSLTNPTPTAHITTYL